MRSIRATVLTVTWLLAVPLAAQQQPDAEAEVRAVAGAFSEALSRGDSVMALGLLHPEVLILEGGRAETKEQYRSSHLAADIAFASSVQSETLRDGVTISGDIALYTRQYRVSGESRGREIDRTSTEALVLIRTAEGWRIRHVHWS